MCPFYSFPIVICHFPLFWGRNQVPGRQSDASGLSDDSHHTYHSCRCGFTFGIVIFVPRINQSSEQSQKDHPLVIPDLVVRYNYRSYRVFNDIALLPILIANLNTIHS